MEIHKIYKLSGIVVWAGLSLVPVAAHADIAVTLSCGSVSGSGLFGGPDGTVTCPGLSSLSSVTVSESTSVSGAMPGTTGGQFPVSIPFAADMFFTPTGSSGVTWSGNSVIPNQSVVGVPGSGTQTATAGVTDANFSSGFNVGFSTDIFDGSATSITGAASVTYDSLLASLGLAPALNASCGSVTGSGLFGGPDGTLTCPAYTPPSYTTTTSGLVLESVTVSESTSVTGAMPGTTGGQFPVSIPFEADMFFTATGSSGVTWSGNGATPNLNVVGVSGSGTQTTTAGVTIANFSSGFNVGVSTDVFEGSATSITGAVSVTYDFGPANAPAAVPEPSSMPLLLGGLFLLLTAKVIRKLRRRVVA